MEDYKLTSKQEKFCQEVVSGKSLSDAYRCAYDCKKSSNNTINRKAAEVYAHGYVTARIDELRQPAIEKAQISAEYVLNNIKEIGERCMQAIQVTDQEGNPTGEFEFKENGALKAMELLGKHLKLFTEKHEHDFGEDTLAAIFGSVIDED